MSELALHDARQFGMQLQDWVRASTPPGQQPDAALLFLAEAIVPALLRYDSWDGDADFMRVIPTMSRVQSDHPLGRLAIDQAIVRAPWIGARSQLAEQACEQLQTMNPPPRLVAMANIILGEKIQNTKGEKDAAPYFNTASSALVEYVRRGVSQLPKNPLERRLQLRVVANAAEYMISKLPSRYGADAVAMLSSQGDIEPCLLATLIGASEIEVAWEFRGTDYASGVSGEGWEGFQKHLTRAAGKLQEAWSLDNTRPEAPTLMIKAAMSGSLPQDAGTEDEWFDRAMRADPTYLPAYAALFWAKLPRWGGSYPELLHVGQMALESGDFHTSVPAQYLAAVEEVAQDSQNASVLRDPAVRENLKRVKTGYAAVGDHRRDRRLNSLLAVAALQAADYEEVQALVRDRGASLSGAVLGDLGVSPRDLMFDGWALSGPLGSQVRAADQLLSDGQAEQALQAYEAVLAKLVADNGAAERRDSLEDRIARARVRKGLDSGKWFDVPVDGRLHGWRQDMGFWKSPVDGQAAGGGIGQPNTLRLEAPVGPRFRASADLLVWSRNSLWQQVGLKWNLKRGSHQANPRAVMWFPNRGVIEVRGASDQAMQLRVPMRSMDAALPLMAHLEITVWDDLLEIRLDDKQIFAGAVKHRQDVGPYVGFGTSDALDARFKVGFQNFKLQKLDELPDSLKKEVVQ